MDLRHPRGIDLNPNYGDSFWGLSRVQARKLGFFFIILGILLMAPPGLPPEPTDVINLFMAKQIATFFPIDLTMALVLTYTVMAWSVFALGIWIYPYSTGKLFNGYITKFKRFAKKYKKDPGILAIAVVIVYWVFRWYESILINLM